jgi:hypothetical protein
MIRQRGRIMIRRYESTWRLRLRLQRAQRLQPDRRAVRRGNKLRLGDISITSAIIGEIPDTSTHAPWSRLRRKIAQQLNQMLLGKNNSGLWGDWFYAALFF